MTYNVKIPGVSIVQSFNQANPAYVLLKKQPGFVSKVLKHTQGFAWPIKQYAEFSRAFKNCCDYIQAV